MNPKMSDLRKKAMALPLLPGVYIMHAADGEIIYIGKAKALKNRVSQYFGSQNNHPEKVRRMVSNVNDFEYIITDSEFEALILECSLIKQHTPKYNILLKDDKGYSYIRVSDGDWGKLSYVLQKKDDGAQYIGPYKSSYYVKSAVEEANKIFMLPTCNRRFPQDFRKGRPCLNYHIKQCMAPCTGRVKLKDYQESLRQALDFLKGGSSNSIKQLTAQMEEAAENLEFERAARIRDKIQAVKRMGDKQKVVANKVLDEDVIASFSNDGKTCFQVFRFEGGRLFDRESFIFDSGDEQTDAEEFLISYYTMRGDVPKNIALGNPLDGLDDITRWLSEKRGSKVNVTVPQRGEQASLRRGDLLAHEAQHPKVLRDEHLEVAFAAHDVRPVADELVCPRRFRRIDRAGCSIHLPSQLDGRKRRARGARALPRLAHEHRGGEPRDNYVALGKGPGLRRRSPRLDGDHRTTPRPRGLEHVARAQRVHLVRPGTGHDDGVAPSAQGPARRAGIAASRAARDHRYARLCRYAPCHLGHGQPVGRGQACPHNTQAHG